MRRSDWEDGGGGGEGSIGAMPGDLGGSWTSERGGGEGSRGEVAGERGAATTAAIVNNVLCGGMLQ